MKYTIIRNDTARKLYNDYREAGIDTKPLERHLETVEIDYNPIDTMSYYDFGSEHYNKMFKRKDSLSQIDTIFNPIRPYILPETQKLYKKYKKYNAAYLNQSNIKEFNALVKEIVAANDKIIKECDAAQKVYNYIKLMKKRFDSIKDWIVELPEEPTDTNEK
jgi:hypothetical protein